jgi:lipoprotein-releasing system ATP-binding protein
MQRVAVARAIVAGPDVVLADEPSGNLDSGNKAELHDLIRDLARERGQAFVIVTHDSDLAVRADREVRMADGRVAEVRKNQVKRETKNP